MEKNPNVSEEKKKQCHILYVIVEKWSKHKNKLSFKKFLIKRTRTNFNEFRKYIKTRENNTKDFDDQSTTFCTDFTNDGNT